eukprot:TRINITY_DN5705_c0_g1_i1.p1 TRINITY_DN5705_c0_g1~~TRINITY_DN5705_c0_g1_i1.p1  ORF type:complete len:595 (+),score=99.80 TRINITY_DN5705_c0_g1_i1:52-1836(+)
MSDQYSEEDFDEDEEEEDSTAAQGEMEHDANVEDALRSGEYKEVKTADGRVYWYNTLTKETTWDIKRTLAGKRGVNEDPEEGEAVSMSISRSSLLKRRQAAKEAPTPTVSPIKHEIPKDDPPSPTFEKPLTLPIHSSDFSDLSTSLKQFAATAATVIPISEMEQPDSKAVITRVEEPVHDEPNVKVVEPVTPDPSEHEVVVVQKKAPSPTPPKSPPRLAKEPPRDLDSDPFRYPQILRQTMAIEEQATLDQSSTVYRDVDAPTGFGVQSRVTKDIEGGILDLVLLMCVNAQGGTTKRHDLENSFQTTSVKAKRMKAWETPTKSHIVQTLRPDVSEVEIVKKSKPSRSAVPPPPGGWGVESGMGLFDEKGSLQEMISQNLEKFVFRHVIVAEPPAGFGKGHAEWLVLNDLLSVLLQITQNQGNKNHPAASYYVKACHAPSSLSPLVSTVMHCLPFESQRDPEQTYRMEYWVTRNHVVECGLAVQRMVRAVQAAVTSCDSPFHDDGRPILRLLVEPNQNEDPVFPSATDVPPSTLNQLSLEVRTEYFSRTGVHPKSSKVDAFLAHTVHDVLTDDIVKKVVTEQVLKKLGVPRKGNG